MGMIDDTRFVERLTFFDGQQLFASDLKGLESLNRELRWLHNKSLHQPGIGNGYAIAGKKGDREITIGPGYAIDSLGREIVLTRNFTIPIPPVAGEPGGQPAFYDLTVSYPDESALEEAETREGICTSRGAVRYREEPVFCWIRLAADQKGNLHPKKAAVQSDIDTGRKLILTRIKILNCRLEDDPLIAQRRSARPPQSPYIYCGETFPLKWYVDDKRPGQFFIHTDVDTSPAGFLHQPFFIARVQGRRILKLETHEPLDFLLIETVQIASSEKKKFTLQGMLLAYPLYEEPLKELKELPKPSQPTIEVVEAAINKWTVVWAGIEA